MPVSRQSVTRSAFASERAQRIPAPPVPAQKRHHVTLVNIHAIIFHAQLKARITVTLILPVHVDAAPVIANVWISYALVNINASIPRGGEKIARVADALEAALQIFALAVLANVGPFDALVDVDAVHEGRAVLVSFGTFAFEAPGEVYALRVSAARGFEAFVLVDALVRVGVVLVAAVTLTFEARRSVHALAVFAHRRHQFAFVDAFGFVGHRVHYLARMGSA